MSDILVFTNRALCREAFLTRIEALAQARPRGIVLREKDLPEEEYRLLARAVMEICGRYAAPCILHSFVRTARELGSTAVHLPLPVLRALSPADRAAFSTLGASCHSAEDAAEAERLGCTYLTAGHVFDTGCKRGLPGRGLAFLREVCRSVSIPVYAIGGIRAENIAEVRRTGAAGGCVMSGMMTCEDVGRFLSAFEVREDEIP